MEGGKTFPLHNGHLFLATKLSSLFWIAHQQASAVMLDHKITVVVWDKELLGEIYVDY